MVLCAVIVQPVVLRIYMKLVPSQIHRKNKDSDVDSSGRLSTVGFRIVKLQIIALVIIEPRMMSHNLTV